MLVLSRNIGQSLFVDEDSIQVRVLGVKGSQVKLGISAPKDTSIHREEIFYKIKMRENDEK